MTAIGGSGVKERGVGDKRGFGAEEVSEVPCMQELDVCTYELSLMFEERHMRKAMHAE